MKKTIFHRDFSQQFQISSFFVQTRKVLHAGFLLSLPAGNYSSIVNDRDFFYKLQAIFSKTFRKFDSKSNSSIWILLDFIKIVDKLLKKIIAFIENAHGFKDSIKFENFQLFK